MLYLHLPGQRPPSSKLDVPTGRPFVRAVLLLLVALVAAPLVVVHGAPPSPLEEMDHTEAMIIESPNGALVFEGSEDADPVGLARVPDGLSTNGRLFLNITRDILAELDNLSARLAAVESGVGIGNTSCLTILQTATAPVTDGFYDIQHPSLRHRTLRVQCDMANGGFTKIMAAGGPAGAGSFFSNTVFPAQVNEDSVEFSRDQYSILGWYAALLSSSRPTFRFLTGNAVPSPADGKSGAAAFWTWSQAHNPFTESTDGSDYQYVDGTASTACGGGNGLHDKLQTYSWTNDADSTDSVGCHCSQIVPNAQHSQCVTEGRNYLFASSGCQCYNWQTLWVR